jgi:hypothetical protein
MKEENKEEEEEIPIPPQFNIKEIMGEEEGEEEEEEYKEIIEIEEGSYKRNEKVKFEVENPYMTKEVDIDLMLYNITQNKRRRRILKDLIIYIPFLFFVLVWIFISTNHNQGYWMNEGIKKIILEKELPYLEVERNFPKILSQEDWWLVKFIFILKKKKVVKWFF